MSPETESPTSPNWREDYAHENGRYLNVCVGCGRGFEGHKRRFVCRVCVTIFELEAENVLLKVKVARLTSTIEKAMSVTGHGAFAECLMRMTLHEGLDPKPKP